MGSKNELHPPDKKRCQAEKRVGSFMTLGRPYMVRCENHPTCIATENRPGADGQRGAMSLCEACADKLIDTFGPTYAAITLIEEGK